MKRNRDDKTRVSLLKKTGCLTLLLLLSTDRVAVGESFATFNNTDNGALNSAGVGLAGANVVPSPNAGKSTDSIVSSTLNSSLTDPSRTQYNAANDNSDRKFNSTDAANQGGTGSNVAAATGIALMTAAIPMLASPLPPVRAAGAVLMADAGLEFLQAGADKKSADKNGDQTNLLKQGEGSQNAPAKDSGTASDTKSAASPDVKKAIADAGLSPDLANKLANGDIQKPEDVLNSLGQSDISPSDLAQGKQIADNALGNIVGSPNGGTSTPSAIGYDSNGIKGPGADGGGSGGAKGSNAGTTGYNANANADGVAGAGQEAENAARDKKTADAVAAAGGGESASGGLTVEADREKEKMDSLLASLLGGGRTEDSPERAALLQGLEGQGILMLNPAQNIFQLAHRNYRNFQKWRKLHRVAQLNR